MKKYRVGDKVRIKECENPMHFFEVGQIVEIEDIIVYPNGLTHFLCIGDFVTDDIRIRQTLVLEEFE